ncbi:MAG: hydroxymethylpyrimidine/phosphomethylpyrimidine kinase [Spirochaetales bacterium]|nr:hydroxymethylpyrimidine/phosphomethylpyrimidine kinase [Spirochaetales bacterium]
MILAIGATDSSGGAGLAQDRRTAERLDCTLRSAVTGITVQGTTGVSAISPAPPDILQKQIETHLTEDHPSAIKIGALCEISQIGLVRDIICNWKAQNPGTEVIADPVFRPTMGIPFLDGRAVEAYTGILSAADIITPNRLELERLSGQAVSNMDEAEYAAKGLAKDYNLSVIITGGHFCGERLEEMVVSPQTVQRFEKDRIHLTKTHGTGCCLSTALAVYIAKGKTLNEAFTLATNFVSRMMSDVAF